MISASTIKQPIVGAYSKDSIDGKRHVFVFKECLRGTTLTENITEDIARLIILCLLQYITGNRLVFLSAA